MNASDIRLTGSSGDLQGQIEALLAALPAAAFFIDREGVTRYANPRAEKLLNLERSDLAGRRYDQPPVEVAQPDGSPLAFAESPVPRALRGERVQGYELLATLPGWEQPRRLCVDAAPYRDDRGEVYGVLVTVSDITEQRDSERALQLSERRLNAVLDNTRMAVFVMDHRQYCIYANAAAEALTGYRFAEMQGRPLHDVVHHTRPDGRHYPLEECPIDRAFPEDFQVEGEETFVHRDGSFYPVAFTASPIRDEASRTVGTVIEVRGIAEEKRREAARLKAEGRVREAEERYRLALRATSDAVWDWDLVRDQVLWNEALERAHGWTLADVDTRGAWWLAQIHPDDRDRIDRSIHAVIDGDGTAWSDEYRFRRADGSWADIFDRGTVLRNERGQAARMIGAMLDQTEQKRQQQALRDSELMLRSLTETMPNMAWVTRPDGAVEWFNAGWYAYTGSAPGTDLGHAWVEYLHPDDRETALARWNAAAAAGTSFENEHRFRGADGGYRWFLARGTPLRDSTGRLARWFGTCTDIQDLVEARNVLARSREQLAAEVQARTRELDRIWNVSEDLFVTCDAELACRNANAAWQRVLGWDPAALDGVRLDTLVDAADLPRWNDARAALVRSGRAKDVDVRMRRREGAPRWMSWNLQAEGDVVYGSGRDITRRMELEGQLSQVQKMETVGKLTGGVAHDFNNLLQVVSGNLQLLARDVAGNTRAETRVRNALAGVTRGAKLASQLLAFGRRQPLEPKVLNVGRLIQGMDDMLRRALGEAIEVEMVVSGGLWNAFADPAQIENAVLNLAINGRDAMEGNGKLTIEAGNAMLDDTYASRHADVTAGQYVMLAVTDTGCGMTPDVLAQAFEPFFSTKPEGKGTGLGLSMVYGFVKQSGGHVKIYSEPGHGTTVRLYLPRSSAPADDAVPAPATAARGGTETILVAEDDDAVRATAVEMLGAMGYRVLKARDAASAMSIIDSGVEIDLLFTDVVMPGPMRSPELARRAKERLPGIGVLFTSGYTENAIVHGGRLDPGVELLAKPYTQEALARKVRHVLANQQQRNRGVAHRPAPQPAAGQPAIVASTVLLVEDDDVIRANTAELLQAHVRTVLQAGNAAEARRVLDERPVDVLVTDLGLPDQRGDAVAALARRLCPEVALVFATGSGELHQPPPGAVMLRKPYDEDALAAALRTALLNRPRAGQDEGVARPA
jgi:PAS domain S-box-containing protein